MIEELPYPSNPSSVPPGYVRPSKAYRRHAWLAVAGLVGFFALYFGATAWFGTRAVTLAMAAKGPRALAGWVGALFAAFFFVFLGKALLPSKREQAPERIEITPTDQPKLFAFVRRIADEVGAPRPHKVYVAPDVNAAVFYETNLLSLILPSRKNLLIGVGLVNVLTLAELKAVLAHEFGHFAQKAMAVGGWVYIGQQVAARIIGRRDVIDRFLLGISYADIRFAWIGWLFRVIAWAIRALTETFFRLVIAAERALSREMELQADRVAVSMAGSDALVHALYRLRAADTAWTHAEQAGQTLLGNGKRVPDLFALQSHALGELRRIFGEETFGDVPMLPTEDVAAHRIFTPALAQPPVMWSTHPPSHEREVNAKEPYIAASLDDRSAWCLFERPEQLRTQLTARELETWGASEDAELLGLEASLALAEERFDKGYLEAKYQGLYLGRQITRQAELVPDLYDAVPQQREAIEAALRDPYPEGLADVVRGARDLLKEKEQLELLEAGIADAPGRSIQHRGQTLKRKELRSAIGRVEAESHLTRGRLHAVDRRIRTAHWAAAATLGDDWANLHSAHLALVHFAEHVESNLDDAMGHLSNVFEMVTADGHVTDFEATRLLNSAGDLYAALQRVWSSRGAIQIGPAVAALLRVESWPQAFEEEFQLHPPARDNLDDWLSVVESWHAGYSILTGELRGAALDVLLDVEAHVRRCWLENRDAGPAPQGPVLQAVYPAFIEGNERTLQLKLGWWERFVTADGWGPGTARLAAAGAIVGTVTFAGVGGGLVGSSVYVYNGLQRPVIVQMGGDEARVDAYGRAEFDLDLDDLQIVTRTLDGELVESFSPSVEEQLSDYAYSIAGAAPLFSWKAVYGPAEGGRGEHDRGAPRWLAANFDYVFEEPPASLTTDEDGTTKSVLSATGGSDLGSVMTIMSRLPDTEVQRGIALTHARWDELPAAGIWLSVAHELDGERTGADTVLATRRATGPRDIFLERLAQDFAESRGDKSEICAEHEAARAAAPSDADATYLALRCRPDDEMRARATIEAFEAHPRHGWLMASTGFAHYRLGDANKAVSLLGRAREALPSVSEGWAGTEARLRRFTAPISGTVSLDELADASLNVRFLLAQERGTDGLSSAYLRLSKGNFPAAQRLANEDNQRGTMMRMIATSDGVDPARLQEASRLNAMDSMSVAESIAGLVIAKKTGSDATAYEAAIRDSLGDDADVVLAFADRERLEADLPALEAARTWLRPEHRGHAAVLGIGMLGEKAPKQWRVDARRLLFGGERPFLRLSVEGESHGELPPGG